MINRCFLQIPGIGPKIQKLLRENGFFSWDDCEKCPDKLPLGEIKKQRFLQEIKKNQQALSEEDLSYFASKMPPKEHWRILAAHFDQAVFIDIETSGLSFYKDKITVIAAVKENKVHTFVLGENMDEFPHFLESCELAVTFNGNSFDMPFISHFFHIPQIGVPHIDLRWVAYHLGFKGGLKNMEKKLGIIRPPELEGVDGLEAVHLYYCWQRGNQQAKDKLIKYCNADAVATCLAAAKLLSHFKKIKAPPRPILEF